MTDRDPVARRPPTRPIGRPVCALAPDAAAPPESDSLRALGPRGGVDRGRAAVARGQTVAVAPSGPQKTDGDPAGGATAVPPTSWALWKYLRPCPAPGLGHAPDRAVSRRWHPAVHPRPRGDIAAGSARPGLLGGALMLQLTPQSRIFLAMQPVDFRKGIDGSAVCRQILGENPLEGAVYVFRNRAGTTLKLLLYDGQGYWLCMKRLSQGRFSWWPTTRTHRCLCPRGSSSLCCGMAIPSARTWPATGAGSPKARPDCWHTPTAAMLPGRQTPRAGVLAPPPGTLRH